MTNKNDMRHSMVSLLDHMKQEATQMAEDFENKEPDIDTIINAIESIASKQAAMIEIIQFILVSSKLN